MRHRDVVEIQELRSTNRVRKDFHFRHRNPCESNKRTFFVMLFVGTPRPSTGVFPVISPFLCWDIGGMDLLLPLLPLLHMEAHIVSG